MKFTAETRQTNVSPRKVRLVADTIRNMAIADALTSLTFIKKRAAVPLKKTLESAIANAVNNGKVAKDTLTIHAVEVSEGPAYKRYHPSTRGRIHPYKKRTSHIRVVLEEKKSEKKVQSELETKKERSSK